MMSSVRDETCGVPFRWPEVALNVVLVEPEIPQNTGTIARLCAATGSHLHLVGPLGFHITNSRLRRAGLDYWESVTMTRHASWGEFEISNLKSQMTRPKVWYFSTKGRVPYTAAEFQPGDALVFGSESKGLPADLLAGNADHVLTIPMQVEHVRSLNLANTVSIALYEALRQINGRKE
jgi:tRNA (cytidine/uridine-2'-O-)-methyltransferase